ncbi:hypothetical protein X760_09965 [Mesorhizobium sp. LSHC422A00]|nr:hypothetical protein X760_09965 [Mesorhizobium sp. LSHC422A00]
MTDADRRIAEQPQRYDRLFGPPLDHDEQGDGD